MRKELEYLRNFDFDDKTLNDLCGMQIRLTEMGYYDVALTLNEKVKEKIYSLQKEKK